MVQTGARVKFILPADHLKESGLTGFCGRKFFCEEDVNTFFGMFLPAAGIFEKNHYWFKVKTRLNQCLPDVRQETR
jgi:hypothetical protein